MSSIASRARAFVPYVLSIACFACGGPTVHLEIHREAVPHTIRDAAADACIQFEWPDTRQETYYANAVAMPPDVATYDLPFNGSANGVSVHVVMLFIGADSRVLYRGEASGTITDGATFPLYCNSIVTQ